MKTFIVILFGAAVCMMLPAAPAAADIERKTCTAADGVTIVYSAAGSGDAALLFIHGALADRSFYDSQLRALSGRYRVIALDLVGHGESGTNRVKWGIPEFATDVKAVADAEKLKRIVLFGNSLGGPIAIEAALLLPKRSYGVVGIDTFQTFEQHIPAGYMRQQAEAYRADFAGSLKRMVGQLFHADADPAVRADAEKRMLRTPPETAYSLFLGMEGYDMAAPVHKLQVPLRAINGDIYPTDVEGTRRIKPDFAVLIMRHMGHYPMLERPEEFNKLVLQVAEELLGKK